MSRLSCILAFGASLGISGCAIHPVPEDVTGVRTYYIVRQIRCEARAAIIDSAIGWLTNSDKVDPAAREIGFKLKDGIIPIEKFGPGLFKKSSRVQSIVALFINTGIAYNYSMEMTENNNLDAQIDLLKPFTNQKRTLGISAGADRQRQNIRTFTVTDTFSGLISHLPPDYCKNFIVQANYIYPIAGKIGMEPMIQEFINLTLFGNLGGPVGTPKGPPTMVDGLDFETTITASATPKVVFTPVGNGVGFADASLTGTVTRKDVHKVTVGLAIDQGSAKQVAPLRATVFGPLLTASGGRTELAAAGAVNQFLTSRLFSNVKITP